MIDVTAASLNSVSDLNFLAGGGLAGSRIREKDWSISPLGAPQAWPQPLKTLVGVMLAADQPMFVGWGPQHILLYNDGYAEMLADRDPAALGCPFLEVSREARDDLTPLLDQVAVGHPIHMDDLKLISIDPVGLRKLTSRFPTRPFAMKVGMSLACSARVSKPPSKFSPNARGGKLRLPSAIGCGTFPKICWLEPISRVICPL